MSSLLNFAKKLRNNVVNTLDRDKSREGFQLLSQSQRNKFSSLGPSQGQQKLIKNVTDFSKGAFGQLTEGAKTMGQGVGKAIVYPFEARRLNLDNQTDSLLQDINLRRSKAAIARGDLDSSRKFSDRISQIGERSEQKFSNFGSDVKEARKKAATGTVRTGLTLFGSGAPAKTLLGGGLLGGGINVVTNKLSGSNKSSARAFGEGAGASVKFAGLNKVTDPIIEPFAKHGAGLVTRAIIKGLGNVGEDIAYNKLGEGRNTGGLEALQSFLLGSGFEIGANTLSKLAGGQPVKVKKDGKVEEIKVEGGYIKNKAGRIIDPITKRWVSAKDTIDKVQTKLFETASGEKFNPEEFSLQQVGPTPDKPFGGMNLERKAKSRLAIEGGYVKLGDDKRLKQLDNFMNDPSRLLKMGYSRDQVSKIGAKEARQIIEKNIPPFEHRSYKKTLDLDPLRKEVIGSIGKDPGDFKEKPSNEFISPDDSKRIAGEAYLSEMEGWSDFKNSIKKWVGNRDVARTVATEKAMKFTNIANEDAWDVVRGLEGKPSNKEGVNSTVKAIRSEYDNLIKEARDSGVDINYLDNYVTHIWKEPVEEVQKIMSARGKFKYNKSRVLPTYDEGIELGLTPKYTHPAQIIEAYVSNLEKAKANVQFINELKDQALLVPASVARNNPDFKPVKAAGIGGNVTEMADGKTYVGDWYAPSKVADTINKVFSEPNQDLVSKSLDKLAGVSSKVQDITLSGGLPGTPVNAFTVANLQKELLAGRIISPLKAFVRSFSPKASQDFFNENIETMKKMQRNNISLRSQFNIEDMIDKTTAQKFGWGSLMNDPTFKRFLPQLQVQFFNDIESAALKAGKSSDEAEQVASQALKNFYGTITSDQRALRSQNSQNATTTFLFAPQFRESMVNFWKNNIGAISPVKADFNGEGIKKAIPSNVRLNNPLSLENRNNTKFLLGAALTYASMDLLNRAVNGKSMSENPKGKEDKLLIPLGDGTTIGIPFLSSIATVPRGVYRQGRALLRGDVQDATKDAFSTYTSSMIKPIAENAMNQDYFGNQIYDPNDTAPQKFMSQGAHLVKSFNHPYIREGLNVATEKLPMSDNAKKSLGIKTTPTPAYQTVSQAMELPIRFYKTESVQNAPFWDSYFKNKAVSEKYGQLKNSDPQKATEYLQANKQAIGEFEKQKRYVGRYYDSGKDSRVLQQYVGNNNSNVVQASTGNNQQVSGDLGFLDPYFGISEYTSMPEGTAMQKAQKEAKRQKLVKDMLTNEDVSPEQRISALSSMGESYDTTDIEYYQTAKLNNDIKVGFVKDYLTGMSGQERSQALALLTQEVAGEKVLSSGVLSTLYKEGLISKSEQNALKYMTFDKATGQVVRTSSGRSKSVNVKGTTPKVSVPSVAPVKANISVGKASLPSVSVKIPSKTPSLINDDSFRELLALAKTDRTKPITFNKIRVRG